MKPMTVVQILDVGIAPIRDYDKRKMDDLRFDYGLLCPNVDISSY